MGQVPGKISYGIAGDGRLARHLAHYFDLLAIPHRQWSRRRQTQGLGDAVEILGPCDIVLVAFRDEAIEPWIKSARRLKPRHFVHFSGALSTPLAAGMHPLMTFGPELYERAAYERIPFVCEQDGPAFQEIFPSLPNPHYRISAEKKALYHALCVMSGNFTVLLWQKLFSDLRKSFGLPAEAALPYLETVARNLARDPEGAATGPLARGDRATIHRNLESLAGDRYQRIYQAFVEAHTQ